MGGPDALYGFGKCHSCRWPVCVVQIRRMPFMQVDRLRCTDSEALSLWSPGGFSPCGAPFFAPLRRFNLPRLTRTGPRGYNRVALMEPSRRFPRASESCPEVRRAQAGRQRRAAPNLTPERPARAGGRRRYRHRGDPPWGSTRVVPRRTIVLRLLCETEVVFLEVTIQSVTE